VKPSFGEKTKEEKRMQTFLPYKDFHRSAKVLDNRRLGKQRVEAYQIINTLEGRSSGWKNHPIVKMWEGHEEALKVYYNVICKEWIRRGFKHNMGFYRIKKKRLSYPAWLGREEFHFMFYIVAVMFIGMYFGKKATLNQVVSLIKKIKKEESR